MAVTPLSQASALNPGAELWIAPASVESKWTARLDWYLNFQISRFSRHQPLQRSSHLEAVLNETQLPLPPVPELEAAPLMISSGNLLPNRWVVLIPLTEHKNLQNWAEACTKVWDSLGKPSLRIFLPPGETVGAFHQSWQKKSAFEDYTCVTEMT